MPAPRVHIDLDDKGERIILRSPFFPGVAEMCKEIPGHNWSKTKSCWTYPVSLQACRHMRHVFTDMLVVGKRLSFWARQAIAEEDAMRALGQLSDTELDRLHEILPRLAMAMDTRTYQRVGASFLANQPNGGVLLADQPGLGKSIQTLGGIVERGLEVGLHLVACPATAINIVWSKEVRKWTDFRVFPVTGSATQKRKAIEAALLAPEDEPRFVIINPETTRIKMGRWCPKCKSFVEDFGTPQEDIDHREAGHKTATGEEFSHRLRQVLGHGLDEGEVQRSRNPSAARPPPNLSKYRGRDWDRRASRWARNRYVAIASSPRSRAMRAPESKVIPATRALMRQGHPA